MMLLQRSCNCAILVVRSRTTSSVKRWQNLLSSSSNRRYNNNNDDAVRKLLMRSFSSSTIPQPPNESEQEEEKKRGKKLEKSKPTTIIPGLVLSAGTAFGGFTMASGLTSMLSVPVSGIPCSILLGMTIKNTIGYDSNTYKPGIVYATKSILQFGIVCVAAKLSFFEMLSTSTAGIPVVLASVGAGLTFIPFAGQLAGLPNQMSLLLTAGTSICGVTAITALAPAIHANNKDIAVAVANTVAFGTIGMLTYPYIFHTLCTSSEQVGMCLGVAIHDTSQVLGSALAYKETFADEVAFKTAAVTKLMRNLGLAVAIPMLTYQHAKSVKDTTSDENNESTDSKKDDSISGLNAFTKYVPPFLVAFIFMSAGRTCGDFLLHDVESYSQVMNFLGNDLSKYALGTAMAGVGLSTDKASLQGVGWRPFAVGLSGALVVGGTGFTVAMLTV